MILLRPRIFRFGDNDITDHNRGPVSVTTERIEKRVRTAGGSLRTFHVADKHKFSVSWENTPRFGVYTVDGFWSGQELRDFYESQKLTPFTLEVYGNEWDLIDTYEVVFNEFTYSMVKRRDIEFWDFSLDLEEV